jgi:3-phenylpropionate/cinnamic acid dioxygenase small subunit
MVRFSKGANTMGARDPILHLIHRYAVVIDTGDFDGLAELFEHGEWTVEGSPPQIGRKDILEMTAQIRIYEDGTPRTKHFTSHVDLDVEEDAGKATGECYVTVFQQTDDFPLQPIFVGHYFDDFERVDGAWRFKRRFIRHHLVGDMSAHLKSPQAVVANA